MSLELVNTFGTLLTVAIIAATAIAAMVQLRHLRAGNQINAMLSIGNQFDTREFRDAAEVVEQRLAAAMEDPAFRAHQLAIIRHLPVPALDAGQRETLAALRLVANTFEELGILLKNGVVDKRMFLDRYCLVISRAWSRMEDAVAWAREAVGSEAVWENFEYITALAREYMRQHKSEYPKGVPRLPIRNRWPVPPMPTTA